jgi:putative salt-induced outer membrane protein
LTNHRTLIAVTVPIILAAACATNVFADDAPPPPQDTWIGKGQIGFLESKGNSNAESINGNIDVFRYDGPWKNELYLAALYGKNSDVVSAERWEIREQTNYTVSGDLFAFGGLRFEHDMFDGFQYQASVTGGMGYKFINTPDTALSAQVGAGYRRLRPETITMDANGEVTSRVPLEESGAAIGTVEVDFMHKFSPTTTLTNKFYTESGSMNTMLQNQLQLTVKMTTKLALSVGYGVIDNTNPPAPLKKIDQLTTVNLQFSF